MHRILLSGLLVMIAPPTAQEPPLRVLHVNPASAILPTEPVTITFDRPVTGSAGLTIDTERVMSLQPAAPVRFDWRDPSTVRLIPLRPWTPGQVLTLVIDTTLVALDGSRLTTPARIPIRVKGPALRASLPALAARRDVTLPPDGRLKVLYSSEIDTARFARIARYVLAPAPARCGRRIVQLRVVQRELVPDDGWQFSYAVGYDSVARAMARVLELVPVVPLPDACEGSVVLPSLDSLDAPEITYPIATAPLFAYAWSRCAVTTDCAASPFVTVVFSAPVSIEAARKAIRADDTIADIVPDAGPVSTAVTLRLSMAPRTVHVISFDSTLTDVVGRRLTGPRFVAVQVGDRPSRVSHPTGFLTLTRDGTPFIRVTHVNVDSAVLELRPLAEPTGLSAALGDGRFLDWRHRSVSRRVVRLSGSRNEIRTTDVLLHEFTTATPPRLLAARIRLHRSTSGLDAPAFSTTNGRAVVFRTDTMTTVAAVMQVTHLAVHARVDEDRGAVLVTDLRRGFPVAGASVYLRDTAGTVLASARTDSSGVAVIGEGARVPASTPLPAYGRRPWRIVDVERAGDRAMLPVTFDHRATLDAASGASPLNAWSGPQHGRRALIFTDRDLYRPGERVYAGAVARDGSVDRLRVPGRDERFRWILSAYQDAGGPRVIHEREATFTRFGTTADSFDLALNAPLGHYQLALQRRIGEQWHAVNEASFRTLEYRAPEFAITLAGDSLPHFAGDTVRWRVAGRYLYDAPMRGSIVRWGATINEASPWELEIPSLPTGFGFGDPAATWEGRRSAPRGFTYSGTDTLDRNGRVDIRIADTSALDGTRRMSLSVAVEDVNRQVVTSSEDATLFGSSHYLALRVVNRGWWWRIGEPVRVEVLAVRSDGSRAAGEPVAARLVHARWIDSSGVGASGRWISDTVTTWSVISADTAIALSFTPRGGGYYTLQLLSRDRQGRPVESRIRRYVYGGAFRVPADGPPVRLAMEPDTVTHAVGASAEVRFESPFESADAWVTVEREGLLRQFRRPVRRGPNAIRIAVEEEMAPTSMVGVVLLNRAPTGADDDSLHRRLRTGMVQLRVDDRVKRLDVTVAPERREVAPGSETRMTVRVSDYRGRGAPAAVTIWAVDEGVLSMGGYSIPDPAAALQSHWMRWLALGSTLPSSIPLMRYRPPFIDSSSTDNMMHLRGSARLAFSANRLALSEVVVTGTGATSDLAATGGAGDGDVRQDFRTTAFFSAVALTNDGGRATVTVRLPDNITTYRVFAVAVGEDDRAGSAESTFVATRPLVVRAALPRFVRPGDTFTAGAAIGTRDGRPRDIHVETAATGIALNGSSRTSLHLSANAGVANFSWSARESDSARITIAATDGTDTDAVRVALPVEPDRFPVARSISGVVRDTVTVRIALPRDIDLERSRLTIRAGTTPLTLLDEARQYLVMYPYMCTEQLLAAARVAVAYLTLQRSGHPVVIDRDGTLRMLQSVVDQLAKRQRADGAFGYWSGDSWSTPWLSTAVGLLLLDAANAGVMVDARLTNRLTAYLTKSLDSLPFLPDTSAGTRLERRQTAERHLGERLAAASYVRRAGQPREAEEHTLLERASLLAWEDRVLLAQLLHQGNRLREARILLERAWLTVGSSGLRVDPPDSVAGGGLFRSRVRPVARLVEATVAIDPSHPRLGALMERLISRTAVASRYWWNTQDYASAASAVAAFTRFVPRGEASLSANVVSAQPGASASVVLRTIDGAAVDTTTSLGARVETAGDSLVLRIRLAARNGPIFYGITAHEFSSVPDTRPLVNGVTVERWYERFDSGEPAASVREGELVRVRLRVTVPNQREFVAVEDHLPAGLEVVDLSLRTSGTLGPFSTDASVEARSRRDREAAAGMAIGSWDSGWWSPWEHSEKRDDRVVWFARSLSRGTYTASYVARATTTGRFIRPPARAEEMYNAATSGRSEGGIFVVTGRQ